MDIREIVKKMNGKDEKGKANSAITMQNLLLHLDDSVKETGITTCHKPEILIERRGKYIQIDLKFLSSLDDDLKKLWGMLEKYGHGVGDFTMESTEMPVNNLTVVPLVYDCQYYAIATNPIFWTLQPQRAGYESNMIRLLYESQNLKFYETEPIDPKEIEEEILREEANNV